MRKTYKVILVEESEMMLAKDGGVYRKKLEERLLAACPNKGNAYLVCEYFKEVYKKYLQDDPSDPHLYSIKVTDRNMSELVNPYGD